MQVRAKCACSEPTPSTLSVHRRSHCGAYDAVSLPGGIKPSNGSPPGGSTALSINKALVSAKEQHTRHTPSTTPSTLDPSFGQHQSDCPSAPTTATTVCTKDCLTSTDGSPCASPKPVACVRPTLARLNNGVESAAPTCGEHGMRSKSMLNSGCNSSHNNCLDIHDTWL